MVAAWGGIATPIRSCVAGAGGEHSLSHVDSELAEGGEELAVAGPSAERERRR